MHLRNYYNQSFFIIIMSDTTNIFDLPTDPAGGSASNISLNASENVGIQQPNIYNNQGVTGGNGGNDSLDQNTINQLVNTLQQASISGATQLPSRDIPMSTATRMNDAHVQPNYIPQIHNVDYISNQDSASEMIDKYNRQNDNKNSLDDMYNEMQTPLLLGVLYFLFQLPFFRRLLFNYFPVLFSNDGNYNINGFIFCSVLFGLTFYTLNKTTNHFSTF